MPRPVQGNKLFTSGKKKKIPITMLIDTSHELKDGYSTITVDKQAESV